ncbi:MAG: helix-turn-helix domain-containing protein [Ruminococcaceae bacterium]|nr:helix-turn-helix domain-containing protein [Oscillospiraceae bacterium]
MFEVAMEELKKTFEDFYNITKFKIVLYDADRNHVFTYPDKMCSFCTEVRKSTELARKCIDCDNIGFDRCDKTRRPYIYRCHMSVVEAIAPIYSNDISIGYLMIGQILSDEKNKVMKLAQKASKEQGITITEKMVNEITSADDRYIESAVNMMSICASYLYTNEIVKSNPDIFVYQLKKYITEHLSGDISIDALCRHFYISKTKLYKLSKANFDMGISDYIRKMRLEKAKKLIEKTDESITDIASAVGINDTNYFIRIFKKHKGVSPLRYRKRFGKS